KAVKDGQLTLMQALQYAERRVPTLYEELLGQEKRRGGQEPKLFDFIRPHVRKLPEVTLIRK
ncbi:MAG: hypothetical protein NTW80_11655, partial [Deltaproteobacteria bacterium]|nr:hypothetical protein [Deltaproteobacteria bacterium]